MFATVLRGDRTKISVTGTMTPNQITVNETFCSVFIYNDLIKRVKLLCGVQLIEYIIAYYHVKSIF